MLLVRLSCGVLPPVTEEGAFISQMNAQFFTEIEPKKFILGATKTVLL
jgi:hypothetical protein